MKRPARGANAADLGIVICGTAIDTPRSSTPPLKIKWIMKRCRVSAPAAHLIADLAKIGGEARQ